MQQQLYRNVTAAAAVTLARSSTSAARAAPPTIRPERCRCHTPESPCAGPWERRGRPRIESIDLAHGQRRAARRKLDRAARCCQGWMEMHRIFTASDKVVHQRMRVLGACGERICSRCSAEARKVRMERLAGDWEWILTLTWAHAGRDACETWGSASAQVARLLSQLNKRHRRRRGYGLSYAWVLEAHKDGWPHAHVVIGRCGERRWIRKRAILRMWQRIVGRDTTRIDWERVRDKSASRHYLAKYLSKQGLPLEIAAALGPARMFGRTVDDAAPLPDEMPWTPGAPCNEPYECHDLSEGKIQPGWTTVEYLPGKAVVQERTFDRSQNWAWSHLAEHYNRLAAIARIGRKWSKCAREGLHRSILAADWASDRVPPEHLCLDGIPISSIDTAPESRGQWLAGELRGEEERPPEHELEGPYEPRRARSVWSD